MACRHRRSVATIMLLYACLLIGCDQQGGGPPVTGAGVDATALPTLIRGLKLRDPAARARSAEAIGRIGPAAKEAVPDLIAALKDRDLSVRAAAVYSLGQIGPDARNALPELKPLAGQGPLREVATAAIKQIER